MKKVIKPKKGLFGQNVTYTVSEELNKLKGTIQVPEILSANRLLRQLPTPLPK